VAAVEAKPDGHDLTLGSGAVPPSLDRRTFLAAGAAMALAAACGGGDDDDTATGSSGTSAPARQAPDEVQVILASAQLIAATDQRVTAGVLLDAEPVREASGVRMAFGRDFDRLGPWVPATYHHEGIDERPYYRATHRFDEPGTWVMAVDAGGRTGATQVNVIAADTTDVPLVGDPMIPVATPTVADARGVDPICTRDPQCPFHDVSLDAALGEGRPIAAIFSTPALCQSRVCGPVLDVLVRESEAFRDRVRIVHVEVYKSLKVDFSSRDALAPGMQAYHLTFEPVLYFAGSDGVIRERLDGPFDAVECRDALGRLAA
jgi:hypothetical protein